MVVEVRRRGRDERGGPAAEGADQGLRDGRRKSGGRPPGGEEKRVVARGRGWWRAGAGGGVGWRIGGVAAAMGERERVNGWRIWSTRVCGVRG